MELRSVEEIATEYQLKYHLNLLRIVNSHCGFPGKRVLEIGGALPEELVVGHLSVDKWIAVDHFEQYKVSAHRGHALYRAGNKRHKNADNDIYPIDHNALPKETWARVDGDAGDLSAAYDQEFDLVISIAAFEHITDLPATLRAMRRAVRPNGTIALLVGPIWSGYQGHHILDSYFPDFADKTKDFLKNIQPWEHLLRSRAEMYLGNYRRYGSEFAELVNYCTYESPHLNRLFADDYFQYFRALGFSTEKLFPWMVSQQYSALQSRVEAQYPTHRFFEWEGFTCLLKVAPTN